MVTAEREEKIKNVVANRQHGLTVVLEDIHDPHNLQAIVRTCDAFGIGDVYIIFEQEKYFNPKRIGKASSSSANKWVDFHVYRSAHDCLIELKKQNCVLVATTVGANGSSLLESTLTQDKIAVIVGNEHRGLSPTAASLADLKITIPMKGMVQSLNVSVATAIILYEIVRQRSYHPEKYKIPKPKQTALTKAFIARE